MALLLPLITCYLQSTSLYPLQTQASRTHAGQFVYNLPGPCTIKVAYALPAFTGQVTSIDIIRIDAFARKVKQSVDWLIRI